MLQELWLSLVLASGRWPPQMPLLWFASELCQRLAELPFEPSQQVQAAGMFCLWSACLPAAFSRPGLDRGERAFLFVDWPDNGVVGKLPGPLDGTVQCDESSFGGHRKGRRGWGAAGKRLVFGILKRNGVVCVFAVDDRQKATLLPLDVVALGRCCP